MDACEGLLWAGKARSGFMGGADVLCGGWELA